MIAPDFFLDQDSKYLHIKIRVPYVKISNAEIYNDNNNFKFYLKPYYLSLTFQEELVPDKVESAIYTHEDSIIHIKLYKKIEHTQFSDLQMINKLMRRNNNNKKSETRGNIPKIEVLSSSKNENSAEEEEEEKKVSINTNENFYCYGFLNQFNGFFGKYVDELYGMCDINPDEIILENRKILRNQSEAQHFSYEHYLSDLLENEELKSIIAAQFSIQGIKNLKILNTSPIETILDQKEYQSLKALGAREVLFQKSDIPAALMLLVDILFGILYEYRSCEGEFNSESGENICKITSNMSYFIGESTIQNCLVVNFRRAICFALYRNFDMCNKVLDDIKQVITLGRLAIIKFLIMTHNLFLKCEPRYLMNTFYINPLIHFVQQICENELEEFKKLLDTVIVSKDMLNLKLLQWEEYAASVNNSDESSSNDSSNDSQDSNNSSNDQQMKAELIQSQAKFFFCLLLFNSWI